VLAGWPSLEVLNLSGNPGIGGGTLCSAIRCCPRLSDIDFGHCYTRRDHWCDHTAVASDGEASHESALLVRAVCDEDLDELSLSACAAGLRSLR
jgi:hypothetical protein